jgi:hypothetical protein
MNRTATIIVPTLDREGHPITSAHAVACDVLAHMARMFGGATMVDGLGAYTMADGTVMFERTAVVTSYTDSDGIEKIVLPSEPSPATFVSHYIRRASRW